MTNGEGKAREKLEEHTRKKKTFPRVCYFRDEVLFRKLLFVPVLRSWKGEEEGEKVGTAMMMVYIYIVQRLSSLC